MNRSTLLKPRNLLLFFSLIFTLAIGYHFYASSQPLTLDSSLSTVRLHESYYYERFDFDYVITSVEYDSDKVYFHFQQLPNTNSIEFASIASDGKLTLPDKVVYSSENNLITQFCQSACPRVSEYVVLDTLLTEPQLYILDLTP